LSFEAVLCNHAYSPQGFTSSSTIQALDSMPAACAGVMQIGRLVLQKLLYAQFRATAAKKFSNFRLKAFVSRVSLRLNFRAIHLRGAPLRRFGVTAAGSTLHFVFLHLQTVTPL